MPVRPASGWRQPGQRSAPRPADAEGDVDPELTDFSDEPDPEPAPEPEAVEMAATGEEMTPIDASADGTVTELVVEGDDPEDDPIEELPEGETAEADPIPDGDDTTD